MESDLPANWNVEERRRYTPAGTDREMEYRTYRHESGDLRVKVAPASLDGDEHPGYAFSVTSYPGLEFSESTVVRTVLTARRCETIARRFMELFCARYDGPGSLEEAVEYAAERTQEHR